MRTPTKAPTCIQDPAAFSVRRLTQATSKTETQTQSLEDKITMENFNFFSVNGWGIGLDYFDIEWFALETNRDHSVVFETV